MFGIFMDFPIRVAGSWFGNHYGHCFLGKSRFPKDCPSCYLSPIPREKYASCFSYVGYDVGGYVYILCWLLYHACEPRASVIKDAEVWSRSTPNSSKPPERMRGPSMILWLRDSRTCYVYIYILLYMYIHIQHIITYSSLSILEPLILNLGHNEVIHSMLVLLLVQSHSFKELLWVHQRMWPDETCFHDLSWVVYP